MYMAPGRVDVSSGDGFIFMASGWPGKGHGTLLKNVLWSEEDGTASMSLLIPAAGGCTVMMGAKIRNFTPLPREVSLEDLVPKDNFYRRLQATLDLSFVRELVSDCYAALGRPSIDPVVFFLNMSRECLLYGPSS